VANRIVGKFVGLVESVTPNPKRVKEDTVRFRSVDDTGTASPYYELFSAPTGVVSEGAYRLTVMIKSVPYSDKTTGKPAAFLSTWVLGAEAL